MSFYLITYDLVAEKSSYDYEPLTEALKKIDAVKTQFSVWIVDHGATQKAIYDYLLQFIDTNDRLMVVTVDRRPSFNTGFKGTRALIDSVFPA